MIDTTIQEFSKRFLALERLFGFQEEAVKLLLEGENVVLRAPTGSGKTVVPILAYTYSKENHYELWDRLIYVVPLRSLASAQYNEYGKFLSNYGASIQIGGESRDEKFEQNVIFCTIDQLLGGYLTLPIGI
ncbi:MAG: DEAD/DEAH box helicase, partial [bacterium]